MPDADDMREGLQDDRKWTLSQVVEGAREFPCTKAFDLNRVNRAQAAIEHGCYFSRAC